MSKNAFLSLFASVVFSGATLYFTFRNVPFDHIIRYFVSINYFWIIPSVLIVVTGFVLRVIRWQIILGPDWGIRFWCAFHPLMIGFMINCVLPGRVGEVARPMILQKKDDVPFPTGIATVATERMFDLTLLISIFAFLLWFVEINPEVSITFGKYHLNREMLVLIGGGMIKLAIVLIGSIIVVSVDSTRKLIIHLIVRLPDVFFLANSGFKDKIKIRVAEPLVRFIKNFASGFSMVKRPYKILVCIVLSAIIWILAPLSMYALAMGAPGIDLSLIEISVVTFIICFFIALPSVPGYWGLWEAGGVFGLTLFGVSVKEAAGFTLANHVVQLLPVMIIGMTSAVISGINFWQVAYNKNSAN